MLSNAPVVTSGMGSVHIFATSEGLHWAPAAPGYFTGFSCAVRIWGDNLLALAVQRFGLT